MCAVSSELAKMIVPKRLKPVVVVLAAAMTIRLYLNTMHTLEMIALSASQTEQNNEIIAFSAFRTNQRNEGQFEDADRNHAFVATLRGKRILIGIAHYGMHSFHFLETQLDAYRDVCEAGAKVDIFILTNNVYTVEVIDELNSRLQCRNTEGGGITLTVHIKSPEWKHYIKDFHRKIFTENVDNYDLFLFNEDDRLIRPANFIAFLDEMNKLRSLVGNKRIPQYTIGFVQYEQKIDVGPPHPRQIFEHVWGDDLLLVDHPNITGRYFQTASWHHHQGMYMATPEQLRAWKKTCDFSSVPVRHRKKWEILHSEVVIGGIYLWKWCNVTQLLPLDSFQDFLLLHMPNKYYKQQGATSTKIHHTRMKTIKAISMNSSNHVRIPPWWKENREYDGIRMFNDEKDPVKLKEFFPDLTEYLAYVKRGGMLC